MNDTASPYRATHADLNPWKYISAHGHILVKHGPKPEMSEGGLHLPKDARPIQPIWHTVIDVGSGIDDTLEPGDKIMFKDTAQVNGKGEIVMRHTAIYIDLKNEILSVYGEQIVAIKRRSH